MPRRASFQVFLCERDAWTACDKGLLGKSVAFPMKHKIYSKALVEINPAISVRNVRETCSNSPMKRHEFEINFIHSFIHSFTDLFLFIYLLIYFTCSMLLSCFYTLQNIMVYKEYQKVLIK